MPKVASELSALAVRRIQAPGHHVVGGVPGLALQVTPGGTAKTWILRATVAGKRRDIGLGGFPGVGLAEAREAARQMRDAIRAGRDPVAERQADRSALKAAAAKAKTFKDCAEAYIRAHEAGWKNAKHGQQWTNTLAKYAFPVIGDMLVADVEREHVLAVVEPIWTTKTETASRVRHRIALVLSYAMQAGYRPEGLNPARWAGGMDKLLPKPGKVAAVTHHAALEIDAMHGFMQRLRTVEGQGARALEFTILTAARSGEVRGATWAEIDLDAKLWTVPAARMKATREHRVPLSDAAVRLLKTLPAGEGQALVFPAPRGGTLSDMTLTAVLRRMDVKATVHGFRSTFRDWAAERTKYPGAMAEMALAHKIESGTEAAYRRGDMLEKRARMMADWAAFIDRPVTAAPVVGLVPRAA